MKYIKLAALLLGLGILAGCASSSLSTANQTVYPMSPEGGARFEGEYFAEWEVDVAPKVVTRVGPRYPTHLKAQGVTGYAEVEFLVDSSGVPTQIHCSGSNAPELAQVACEAIAQWRYIPAQRAGRVVQCRVTQMMTFTISE